MSRLRKASRRFLERKEQDDDASSNSILDEQGAYFFLLVGNGDGQTLTIKILEQEQIIDDFYVKAVEQEQFFKQAIVTLTLFPTPLFIALPYCRHNAVLSLLSLTSIAISAYLLYFQQGRVAITTSSPSVTTSNGTLLSYLSGTLSLLIVISGYLEHSPWRDFDYIWTIPLVSSIVSMITRRWINQTFKDIEDLTKKKYHLKGA
jgi:hypothetical protein